MEETTNKEKIVNQKWYKIIQVKNALKKFSNRFFHACLQLL